MRVAACLRRRRMLVVSGCGDILLVRNHLRRVRSRLMHLTLRDLGLEHLRLAPSMTLLALCILALHRYRNLTLDLILTLALNLALRLSLHLALGFRRNLIVVAW